MGTALHRYFDNIVYFHKIHIRKPTQLEVVVLKIHSKSSLPRIDYPVALCYYYL